MGDKFVLIVPVLLTQVLFYLVLCFPEKKPQKTGKQGALFGKLTKTTADDGQIKFWECNFPQTSNRCFWELNSPQTPT